MDMLTSSYLTHLMGTRPWVLWLPILTNETMKDKEKQTCKEQDRYMSTNSFYNLIKHRERLCLGVHLIKIKQNIVK